MKFRIKEVGKQKNISMKKIADELKVFPNTLSLYHSGKAVPPIPKLEIIAEILDCDITELITPGKGFAHFYADEEYQGIRKV